jgi:hypothetical protein
VASKNQWVTEKSPAKSGGLTVATGGRKIADQLHEIARAVRQIGDPFCAAPKTLCIQKTKSHSG